MTYPCCGHAFAYTIISVVLAFATIASYTHHSHHIPITRAPNPLPQTEILVTNVTQALRKSGFYSMANLLQLSADRLLPARQGTLFAIVDPSISNLSLPGWLMRDLMQYHSSPLKFSMEDLLLRPQGSCIPTLLQRKNLVITNFSSKDRMVKINGVRISHPDIYLDGSYAIHGVLAPFYDPKFDTFRTEWALIPSPICIPNSGVVINEVARRIVIPWPQILRWLSSNGFISFSISLHLVLDSILQDFMDVNSVTIFAPPDNAFAYVAAPSPLLERIIRFHIVPRAFSYGEFVAMPPNTSIPTLVSDEHLIITGGGNFTDFLSINGAKVTEPDMFSSMGFVIHGIKQVFEMVKLST